VAALSLPGLFIALIVSPHEAVLGGQEKEEEKKMEAGVARAVGMCLWSRRARLITTADCVGDGRNTLAAHRGGGGGVGECPQRESGSQMLLSLPLSPSLPLALLSTALTLRPDPRA